MWLDVSDEPPILNGFGEVLGLDVFTVFQVSDGSSGFEYLIVGTGDQAELVNCSNSYQLGPMGWRCATWRRCWDGPASTRRLAERAASMVPDDAESFYRAGAAALQLSGIAPTSGGTQDLAFDENGRLFGVFNLGVIQGAQLVEYDPITGNVINQVAHPSGFVGLAATAIPQPSTSALSALGLLLLALVRWRLKR